MASKKKEQQHLKGNNRRMRSPFLMKVYLKYIRKRQGITLKTAKKKRALEELEKLRWRQRLVFGKTTIFTSYHVLLRAKN